MSPKSLFAHGGWRIVHEVTINLIQTTTPGVGLCVRVCPVPVVSDHLRGAVLRLSFSIQATAEWLWMDSKFSLSTR